MLPKAVLSWVGRLVGIAAVVASPLVARAAEATDAQPAKTAHKTVAPHSHTKAKGAKKKSSHAKPAKAEAAKDDGRDEARSDKAAEGSPGVIAEKASTRSVPKPSKTPLPTVAAAATVPLVLAKAPEKKASVEKGFDRGHAVEPRKTPVLRASTRPEHEKTKKAKSPCLSAPVEVTRGKEDEAFSLTKCDGKALPEAVDEISVLIRPGSAARPQVPLSELSAKGAKSDGAKDGEIAPGIRRIDARLVERIQRVIDHFAKPGTTPQIYVISGYRPSSKGSFHANGRAIDFRLQGVENTDLVAFCKTLDDTGCGFYPNSSFIHMDVRDQGAGHVAWIDASGAGDKPDYVASWPPPPKDDDADPVKMLAHLDELEFLPKEDAVDKKPACAGEEDSPAAVVVKKTDGN